MRPIDRDEILELLGHQGFHVIEVSAFNAAQVRAACVPDLVEGNLVWRVIDPAGRHALKFAAVYCGSGRPPPHRGLVQSISGRRYRGEVLVDERDPILWLKDSEGCQRMNGA